MKRKITIQGAITPDSMGGSALVKLTNGNWVRTSAVVRVIKVSGYVLVETQNSVYENI